MLAPPVARDTSGNSRDNSPDGRNFARRLGGSRFGDGPSRQEHGGQHGNARSSSGSPSNSEAADNRAVLREVRGMRAQVAALDAEFVLLRLAISAQAAAACAAPAQAARDRVGRARAAPAQATPAQAARDRIGRAREAPADRAEADRLASEGIRAGLEALDTTCGLRPSHQEVGEVVL